MNRFLVSLTDEAYDKVVDKARRSGLSYSAVVRMIVNEYYYEKDHQDKNNLQEK